MRKTVHTTVKNIASATMRAVLCGFICSGGVSDMVFSRCGLLRRNRIFCLKLLKLPELPKIPGVFKLLGLFELLELFELFELELSEFLNFLNFLNIFNIRQHGSFLWIFGGFFGDFLLTFAGRGGFLLY